MLRITLTQRQADALRQLAEGGILADRPSEVARHLLLEGLFRALVEPGD